MNNIYFICRRTKIIVDVTYHWSRFLSEYLGKQADADQPDIEIDVDSILSCEEYWAPMHNASSSSEDWLKAELAIVHEFMIARQGGTVLFGEYQLFMDKLELSKEYFEWKEIGHCPEMSPRYFIEDLGFGTWGQCTLHMDQTIATKSHDNNGYYVPMWWTYREYKICAKPQLGRAKAYFRKATRSRRP